LQLLILLIGSQTHAAALPYFETKEMTPYWLSPDGRHSRKHVPAGVSHFVSVDQDGRTVGEESMKGRLTLVNFFFVSCPGVCPAMMKSVQKMQKELAQEIKSVQIFSFSVMPEKDTPAKLKEYSKTYGIDGGNWRLLTGNKADIYRVGKQMFRADGAIGKQKNENSFVHTQNIYLVDGDLKIRGIYNSSDTNDMKNLRTDIRILESPESGD
jgi:protein SCO1/2